MSIATSDRLGVRVEVWPLAADQFGIWLVSDEAAAWRSDHVTATSNPHSVVAELLGQHQELSRVQLLHSTSWRTDHDAVVLTYVAVLGGHGSYKHVRDVWPEARQLSLDAARAVGKPGPHGPTEQPAPRDSDVLLHAVRHLRFLLDTSAAAQAALDDHWRQSLDDLQPMLAGMYE